MHITDDIIKESARLAKIPLTEEAIPAYTEAVRSILSHIEKIKELSLEGVPETPRVTEEVNVWREDTVGPSFTPEEALRSGKKRGNYFEVPAVLKK